MSQNQNVVVAQHKSKAPKNLRRKVAITSLGLTTAATAVSANAAMDVSELVSGISDQVSNIETIGLAILGVLVVIAGISLLRRVVR